MGILIKLREHFGQKRREKREASTEKTQQLTESVRRTNLAADRIGAALFHEDALAITEPFHSDDLMWGDQKRRMGESFLTAGAKALCASGAHTSLWAAKDDLVAELEDIVSRRRPEGVDDFIGYYITYMGPEDGKKFKEARAQVPAPKDSPAAPQP